MDERLMKKCVGKPVPEWDMAHRLHIDQPVGPNAQDFGTIFRINSVYMDVVEPSFLEKQWSAAAIPIGIAGICIGPYLYWLTEIRYPYSGSVIGDLIALLISLIFAFIVWKFGQGLFFGLRRRPIRFHRGERKLYSIRKRRHFAKPSEGDIVWEVPWSKESIFCLHREMSTFGELFHIRHYTVNDQGNVTRVFSIGREWMPAAEVEMALAQWNYWCKYMSDGPHGLPKPMLFHTEDETPRESFLFSLYGFGMQAPVLWRIIMMPLTLAFTAMRILANSTSRDPIWPSEIAKVSDVDPNDPYAQPRSGTPVGWGDTVLAQQRGDYPNEAKTKTEGWAGEPDGKRFAMAWLKNPAVASPYVETQG
ncbi:DUF6708 domain-containing protein [Burkholderia gladioli]|uniref:DUF6708 domain-containing protein n=1 Tax=Burkholderia gladioli TaxID=28095 RepID=UPI0016414EF7|nr:DUF6708 domain-containing protein [Burkholderia gladioli]